MAGELERRRPPRRELDADAARLGNSFGLGGPCQGICLARRRSTQWGCGAMVLGLTAISAFVVPDIQHHYTSAWGFAAAGAVLAGLMLIALAPRANWDRLYWYPGGIARE